MPAFHPALPLAAPLGALPGDPRSALDRLPQLGYRRVQLSAVRAGMRPRELDRSARRDLEATLRRRDLIASGLDAWIPAGDLLDPERMDRAVGALMQVLELAADLGGLTVSLALPDGLSSAIETLIVEASDARGVLLADHAVPVVSREAAAPRRVGVDPAAWLAAGLDPAAGVAQHAARLAAARLTDLTSGGMRAPIGGLDGRLDVEAYRVALSVCGFSGAVVVDARQWSDPWEGLERTAAAWGGAEPGGKAGGQ